MEIFFLLLFVLIIIVLFVSAANKTMDDQKSSRSGNLKDSISSDLGSIRESAKKDKRRKATIQKKYKLVAKFYNSYKFIDYGEIKNKKIATKQMSDIVNVVDKNLYELQEITEYTPYPLLLVGMITFKLTTKEQVIKVNNDLKKMYKLGKMLDFDERLMKALENILKDVK